MFQIKNIEKDSMYVHGIFDSFKATESIQLKIFTEIVSVRNIFIRDENLIHKSSEQSQIVAC